MNENPYSTRPLVAESELPPESRELESAQMIPSLRFITLMFAVEAIGATIYGLNALVTLRDTLRWSSEAGGMLLYSLFVIGYAFAWPGLMVYGVVRIWQYREQLELFIAGEVACQPFAQAHLNLWRAFTIQSIVGIVLYILNWALPYVLGFLMIAM